ncbi:SDR family oxidoreductase [candidate division KSB1 bacterium]|nr:SDR family oxidoreductase [candidate division KSB1 bacterium]
MSGVLSLFDLTGKVALITGSSSGLGWVMARGLGRAGARVVLNGRDTAKLDAAVKRMAGDGIPAIGVVFDVCDKQQIQKGVQDVFQRHRCIDILINNAGIHLRGDLAEISEDAWQQVLDTNLKGVLLTSQAVVPAMIERGGGKIINICSLQSERSRPTTGTYAAAKGGVKMLTKAMAVDWAKHNIQVNGIGPGYFLTSMTRPLAEDPQFDAWYRSRTPANRWGYPEELVGAVVFLASKASNFINGHILYVDGGFLAAM